MIAGAQNGEVLQQLGSRVGLSPEQTSTALSALVPALAGGVQQKLQGSGGFGPLAAALASGRHQQYIDNPSTLGNQAAVDHGNEILGHVLGGKDASRDVAEQASAQTGLSTDVLKQLLPLAASAMMGVLSKRATQTPGAGAPSAGLLEMLTPLLDRNRDGSIVDDVTGMLGRFRGGQNG
jgi:hypothetical protein